jgi:beta-1,4-N-acetylglucosaminyltransferase
MKYNDKLRICFAASSGGHFEQLMMLKPIMEKYNGFIVTEKTEYISDTGSTKSYYLLQVNREEKLCIAKLIVNAFKSLRIFIREKPDVIICTGVLAMVPLCLICKLFGKKLIYIESFAKVTSPTMSGKLLYKCADRFYVQWPQMKKIYPNAIYLGGIY